MFEVTNRSTHKEILLSLWARPRYEVTTLCVILNKMGYEIPNYLTKEQMMEYLAEIEKEDLLEAIATIDAHEADDEEDTDEGEDDEDQDSDDDDDTDEDDDCDD